MGSSTYHEHKQGKFELKSTISKRWYIQGVSDNPESHCLVHGHPERKFLDIALYLSLCEDPILGMHTSNEVLSVTDKVACVWHLLRDCTISCTAALEFV